jgi:hypothetical protein
VAIAVVIPWLAGRTSGPVLHGSTRTRQRAAAVASWNPRTHVARLSDSRRRRPERRTCFRDDAPTWKADDRQSVPQILADNGYPGLLLYSPR